MDEIVAKVISVTIDVVAVDEAFRVKLVAFVVVAVVKCFGTI